MEALRWQTDLKRWYLLMHLQKYHGFKLVEYLSVTVFAIIITKPNMAPNSSLHIKPLQNAWNFNFLNQITTKELDIPIFRDALVVVLASRHYICSGSMHRERRSTWNLKAPIDFGNCYLLQRSRNSSPDIPSEWSWGENDWGLIFGRTAPLSERTQMS